MKKSILILSSIFFLISVIVLLTGILTGLSIFSSLFFLFIFLGLYFEDEIYYFRFQLSEDHVLSTHCQIRNDHFYFPKGYYFKHGRLKKLKQLPFHEIIEIRTNTSPISAKVSEKELIFLFGLTLEELNKISTLKEKQIHDIQDNWELLLEEFLDTEFEEDHKCETLKKLKSVGISQEEIKSIRKQFKYRMLTIALFSMEWAYFGQFDILRQIWPLTSKKYWWTMEIALKNKKTHHNTR